MTGDRMERPIQVHSSQIVTGDEMGRPDLDQSFRGAAGLADRVAVAGMGFGLLLMLQPWWDGGLRAGFFVTLAGVIAQTVTGHLQSPKPPARTGAAAAERSP